MKLRGRNMLALAATLVVLRVCAEELPAIAAQNGDTLHIDRPEVVVELLARYNGSRTKDIDGSAGKNRDTSLEERLRLDTRGYVGSPDFLEFNLGLTLGVDESWEKRAGHRDNDVDGIVEYHFDATLMGNSRAPFTILAERTVEYTSQPFSETYRSTTNTYDATWNLQSARLPTYVRMFHTDIAQDSLTGWDNFAYDQNSVEWHTDAIFVPGNRLNWNYNFTSVNQKDAFGHDASYNSNAASLVHQYEFGAARQNSLTSTVEYMNQEGDFAQERFRLDENLLLRHSDRLDTFYQYQFEDTRYPEVETSLNRLKGGFRSRIFDNLHATGTLGGMTMEQSGAGTDELFAHLDFDYTKKVPYGVLAAMLQLGLDWQSNEAQNAEAHVMDTRSFDASQQIVIPYVGIKSNSIGVRNAKGTRVFAEGLDYLTVYHKNRAIIQRIPGGSLAPNSAVLIDYDVNPRPANDVATDNINMGLRYDVKEGPLKGLGLYTRYFAQNQDISTEQPGAFIADDVNALVYGAEYRLWRLRFSAEHEDHESDLIPFRSNRFGVRYEDRIGRDWRLFADATQVRTEYEDDDTNPIATTLAGRIEYRPSREISAGFTVGYLRLEDEIGGKARGLEEQLDLKWTHRETTIKGQLRHSALDTDTQDSAFLFLQLSIERRF